MTNKELQFALDKALEIAKAKDREIKALKAENQRLINNNMISERMINTIAKHKGAKLRYDGETHTMSVIPNVPIEDMAIHPNYSETDHTRARITISAIIGIAAGFILALILL
jgi:hypothetical protein